MYESQDTQLRLYDYLNTISNNDLQTQTARGYCKFNIPASIKNM